MQRKSDLFRVTGAGVVVKDGKPTIVENVFEYPNTYNLDDALKKFRKETGGATPIKIVKITRLYKMDDEFFFEHATIDSETIEEVDI